MIHRSKECVSYNLSIFWEVYLYDERQEYQETTVDIESLRITKYLVKCRSNNGAENESKASHCLDPTHNLLCLFGEVVSSDGVASGLNEC